MKEKLTPLLLLTLLVTAAKAQSNQSPLDAYFTALRQDHTPTTPDYLWQDSTYHASTLLALPPYYTDSLPHLRAQAYWLTQQVGIHSHQPALRQQATTQLVSALSYESRHPARLYHYLATFRPADFPPEARQHLASLLSPRPTHLASLLRLIGTLDMSDQVPTLQSLLAELSAAERWVARLALARLGDEESLAIVLARVKRYPVNDEVVYELLPELVYTRQPAALDYLVTIVQSDEKRCQSADPEGGQSILCGYRVLELLAPVVADFPLTVEASGDLATDDYPAALQQARRWLQQHTDYRIVKQ